MKITIAQNATSTVIRFSHNQKRYQIITGPKSDPLSLPKAELLKAKIYADILADRFTFKTSLEAKNFYLPKIENQSKPTELLIDFLETRKNTITHNSLNSLIGLIQKYGKPVTEQNYRDFSEWLCQDRETATVKRYLSHITPYSRDLAELISENLSKKTTDKELPKPFSKLEVQKIIAYFNGTDYGLLIETLFTTGLRLGEALGLTYGAIDPIHRQITVRATLSRSSGSLTHKESTKTGRIRIVPCPDNLASFVSANPRPDNALVFITPSGKPIDSCYLGSKVWKPALKRLGIPHRPIYNTRHTFCSHFLQNGGTIAQLARLTHNSASGIQTLTTHYVHLTERITIPDMYQ